MWPERHPPLRPDRIYSISSESFEGEGRVVVNPLRACGALRRQSPPSAETQRVLNPTAAGVALTGGVGVPSPRKKKTPPHSARPAAGLPASREHGEPAAVGLSERARGYPLDHWQASLLNTRLEMPTNSKQLPGFALACLLKYADLLLICFIFTN